MQHVKVKYSQKPHLKKGAGWFGKSFYRYRVWQDNHRYNYYDRHRRNVAIRLGGLLVIGVGILVVILLLLLDQVALLARS